MNLSFYLSKFKSLAYLFDARNPKLCSRDFFHLLVEDIVDLVAHRAQVIHRIHERFYCVVLQSLDHSVHRTRRFQIQDSSEQIKIWTHICFWSSFVYESSKYSAAEYSCVLKFFKSWIKRRPKSQKEKLFITRYWAKWLPEDYPRRACFGASKPRRNWKLLDEPERASLTLSSFPLS